jgi:ergothioneine biosynthesis protein EgtC
MCRFVLYLGEPITLDTLTTRPRHSLIQQSYHARLRPEPLNGDGFGIGWWVHELSERPAVYRSTSPAWNDPNLRDLARVTRSPCVMAHVRAATPPLPVTQLNCHPFAHGPIALMHNGYIPGFARLRRSILADLSDEAFHLIDGSTDSEHLLALFFDRYVGTDGEPLDRLWTAWRDTMTYVSELCTEAGIDEAPHLNVALSDGRRAVVSRVCRDEVTADSLYVRRGDAYVCSGEHCRMLPPDGPARAVIVASEPLSSDPGWELVPLNHAVLIDEDRSVRCEPAFA